MNSNSTEFGSKHYEMLYPKGVENHYWQIARNKMLYNEIKSLDKGESLKILEVGCGRGDVVMYMRSKGIDYQGVELASDVPVIQEVKDFVIIGTDANQLPEDFRKGISIITLFDVIEHLPDPSAFLNELIKNYPNLTHFVITVPACQEIWSNYDEFNGHYRRYHIDMMKAQSKDVNAELVKNRFFFKMLYLPARILLSLKKKRSEEFTVPTSAFSKFVHRLIAQTSLLIDGLFPASFKGSSVFSILKIKR
jgi:hypothetical protein